jgi:hypothetical protein
VLWLGGVAAFMALVEMKPLHKALYFALIMALIFTENRAIDKDRHDFANDEANRRTTENTQFSNIGSSITDNVQKLLDSSDSKFRQTIQRENEHFAVTTKRSDAIFRGVIDTMKTQTGGDSFAYITFTPESGDLSITTTPTMTILNAQSGPPVPDQFLVSIASHGKYPLREVNVWMKDAEQTAQAMLEYSKRPGSDFTKAVQAGDTNYQIRYLRPVSPESPTGDVKPLGLYPPSLSDAKDLDISFSSSNGYWNERLHLRKIDGKWHQALSVMGPTTRQVHHPFIYSDADYPEGKAIAEKDWKMFNPTVAQGVTRPGRAESKSNKQLHVPRQH